MQTSESIFYHNFASVEQDGTENTHSVFKSSPVKGKKKYVSLDIEDMRIEDRLEIVKEILGLSEVLLRFIAEVAMYKDTH